MLFEVINFTLKLYVYYDCVFIVFYSSQYINYF